MELIETVFPALEALGVVAFALSGAILAIERNMDLFGVLFLALTTALGGGAVRDILLGRLPPMMFTSYVHIVLSLFFALVAFLLVRLFTMQYVKYKDRIDAVINLVDAVGLAAFSIIGVQTAISSGFIGNAFLCVFLGMTTGVGGGIMRDIMSARIPLVLRKRVYATASIFCSLVYFLMVNHGMDSSLSIVLCMVLTCLIRMLSTRYKWHLPHAMEINEKQDV